MIINLLDLLTMIEVHTLSHKGKDFTYTVKSFSELSSEELYLLTKIRQEVFVVEQDCVFVDSDGYDLLAFHFILFDEGGQIAGYARILAKDTIYDKATIGRVLTTKAYRQTGLGREVFRLALEALYQKLGRQAVKIQAQSYLLQFYESFGFKSMSEAYLDTGILHNDMIKADA